MDFITGLPKFEGKSVIMVVVDRLTKYAHFFALSHPFKASMVANTKNTWYSKYYSKCQGSHFHWKLLDPIIFLFEYSIGS